MYLYEELSLQKGVSSYDIENVDVSLTFFKSINFNIAKKVHRNIYIRTIS